ncbi:hypothetical protein Trydic_g16799 [Trypoxylus dichotomus]
MLGYLEKVRSASSFLLSRDVGLILKEVSRNPKISALKFASSIAAVSGKQVYSKTIQRALWIREVELHIRNLQTSSRKKMTFGEESYLQMKLNLISLAAMAAQKFGASPTQ